MNVTVAFVTARRTHQTRFKEWCDVRRAVALRQLYGDVSPLGVLPGEFVSLIMMSCTSHAASHLERQLIATQLGTEQPNHVLIVDRASNVFVRRWPVNYVVPTRGEPNKSYGCHDKNTAIMHAPDSILIMLDDCCLPSFGLIETVKTFFEDPGTENDVFMLGHQKIFLPKPEQPRFDVATANWVEAPTCLSPEEAQKTRRVCGIWAMRLETILAVNGFNEKLDGGRNGLDEELMVRLDRYLTEKGGSYFFHPNARVYEIEHDMPWANAEADAKDWREHLPAEGYRAPGADLAALRSYDLVQRSEPKLYEPRNATPTDPLKGTMFDT